MRVRDSRPARTILEVGPPALLLLLGTVEEAERLVGRAAGFIGLVLGDEDYKQAERIDAAECRISAVEDDHHTDALAQCKTDKTVPAMQAKIENFEAHLLRNNI
ncbi:hypothetical protein NDU88_006442 [Pleurodeles waltl]|uniref:Uncharacterized protein n=1 Tax=Pleurodeles waltl TaxID=8319 RepID=A0AAV7PIU1_PLEWA|nr:hypothetical protein NDU88_006442 [Pleurodeles waltl]